MAWPNKNKKFFNNWFRLIFLACLAIFLLYTFSQIEKNKQYFVKINNQTIEVELAVNPEDQARGLGGRDSLLENSGMLFVYGDYVKPAFWMKEMRFPIDIIWIKDRTVVGLEQNVQPVATGRDLPLYRPGGLVNYVLEVNAGYVEKYGISVGDKVEFVF